MRILHINKYYYLRGGAERHMFQVMDVLRQHGHDVFPFATEDSRNVSTSWSNYFVSPIQFDPPNFRTLRHIGRIIYSPEAYRKTLHMIDTVKPDVAHVHLLYHHLSPAVLLALKKRKIPVVITLHDWQMLSPNYSFATLDHLYTVEDGKKLWHVVRERAIKGSVGMSLLAVIAAYIHRRMKWFHTHVDAYIAPTQFVKQMFVQSGFDEQKIVHIPHFCTPTKDGVVSTASTYKEPYVLYAGRLSWEKGIEQLIDVWIAKRISYTLRIAGTGPLAKQLQEKVRMSGVQTIEFLGFVPPDVVLTHMTHAACVIAPSVIYETFGLSVIEAWAAGTAVFAHGIGSFVELVSDSSAGVLFSYERVDDFVATLDQFMANPQMWVNMGQAGQLLVQKKYSAEQYYASVMNVYQRVCKTNTSI
jgi:glycosyltransferase involved in cell wall biosynthesis